MYFKGLQYLYHSLKYMLFILLVKPAHAVTSIKQSPILKGHIFLVLS
jgi:hypothetical protein